MRTHIACTIKGCDGKGVTDKQGIETFVKGFCVKHYKRNNRYGNPLSIRFTDSRASHKLYFTYKSMVQRCTDKTHKTYANYGGRGITVCDRWLEEKTGFWNFVADLGKRPENTSLDRINNSKGYYPDNCRWATSHQQQSNRRNTKIVGVTLHSSGLWVARLQVKGMKYSSFFKGKSEAIKMRKQMEEKYLTSGGK